MDIVFKNKSLEKLANSEKELVRKLGPKEGRLVIRRMDFLRAATCLAEIPITPPFFLHPLKGGRAGQYSIRSGGGLRIVFQPNHNPVPEKSDGDVDLTKVTAIIVVGVEDYHDE